jgi:hypothetical protein
MRGAPFTKESVGWKCFRGWGLVCRLPRPEMHIHMHVKMELDLVMILAPYARLAIFRDKQCFHESRRFYSMCKDTLLGSPPHLFYVPHGFPLEDGERDSNPRLLLACRCKLGSNYMMAFSELSWSIIQLFPSLFDEEFLVTFLSQAYSWFLVLQVADLISPPARERERLTMCLCIQSFIHGIVLLQCQWNFSYIDAYRQ